MSNYTKDEIICKMVDKAENTFLFYKEHFINYRGRAADTGELYSEIVAEWVIDHIDKFQEMKPIRRETSYFTVGHNGMPGNLDSNREEEMIAMKMFRQGIMPIVGKILDYQTPLKNKKEDKAGKIDLLTFDGKILRILELKEPDSNETMLRCVLEGYTYLKTVNTKKLISDFNRDIGACIPEDSPVKACPFVFRRASNGKNGVQYQEMQEDRPMLKKLMQLLDIKPLYIEVDNGEFIVTEE